MQERQTGRAPSSGLALPIDAIDFAAFKHRDQTRKGRMRVSCINLPFGLARVLAVEGGTGVATLAAAMLHDTIEDASTSPGELERRFGKSIARVLPEVTDMKTQPKRMRKVLQVRQAPRLSDRAKLVKLADKICNLRDIVAHRPEGRSLAQKQEHFDWAAQVVQGLGRVHPKREKEFARIAAHRAKLK